VSIFCGLIFTGLDDGDDFVGLVGSLRRFDWVLGRNRSGKRVWFCFGASFGGFGPFVFFALAVELQVPE
jgi:hypothetical protein